MTGAHRVTAVANPYTKLVAPPIECRDLHELLLPDGTPVVPLDHWGLGCPFDEDE